MTKSFRRAAPFVFAALVGAALPFPAQAATAPRHVILIMMENHGTDTLIGNKDDAPFINELIGQKGVMLATQYYGVTHPSLPNYLALVSGDYQGIHDDCKAGADVTCKPEEFSLESEEPPMKGRMMTDEQEKIAATTAHWFKTPTFLDQLEATGRSWKVYMQGMAPDQKLAEYAPLDASGKVVAKLYAQKHNTFVYFAAFHDDAKRLEKMLPTTLSSTT
jgi:phosphatidylinositol-3-phosphatase